MWALELREACDYSKIGVEGGHFDGTLAYKLAYAKLFQSERTQADIDFYDTAKQLQKKTLLADGCRASEFMAKAYAWIYKIRPFLAQSYSEADAAEFIVQLMPRRLGPDARRIKDKLKEAGKLGDLMHLARELEKIVYADQNASPPAPALVMLESELSAKFDLMALADMTGMALVAAGAKPAGTAGGTGVQLMFGQDGKWCSKCDSHNPCFLNPLWAGPLPVFLHKNAEKKKVLLKGRADNAKGANPPVTCQVLKAPSADAIKAYEERRARGRGRGKPNPKKGAAAALEEEQVGGGVAVDFYASLCDITDVQLGGMVDDNGIYDDPEDIALMAGECDSDEVQADDIAQWFVVRSRAGVFSVRAAPRLPSGTLVNKAAIQAVRGLNLGYYGNETGSFEQVGITRCQPAYAVYIPSDEIGCGAQYANTIYLSGDVRFIPTCFPGLQRCAGGGYRIPLENIPFIHRELPQPEAAAQSEEPVQLDAASDGMPPNASEPPQVETPSPPPESLLICLVSDGINAGLFREALRWRHLLCGAD